ncbi:MAG: hypothetical protein AAF488_15580, partial [Planctomycetota bacterium]
MMHPTVGSILRVRFLWAFVLLAAVGGSLFVAAPAAPLAHADTAAVQDVVDTYWGEPYRRDRDRDSLNRLLNLLGRSEEFVQHNGMHCRKLILQDQFCTKRGGIDLQENNDGFLRILPA